MIRTTDRQPTGSHPIIEVELKFPVSSTAEIRELLLALGADQDCQKTQSDEYFDDPLRGFANSDHALRIRRSGDSYWLTFKGPNLDTESKMREELELPLVDLPAAEELKQVFLAIGFSSIAKVHKTRDQMSLDWSGSRITICLDQVDEVGEFVELEIVAVDQSDAELAKTNLLSLAKRLELTGATRTSYLRMLLANRGPDNRQ